MGANSGRHLDFTWEFWDEPPLGDLEEFLLGIEDSEVIG